MQASLRDSAVTVALTWGACSICWCHNRSRPRRPAGTKSASVRYVAIRNPWGSGAVYHHPHSTASTMVR